MERLVLLPSKHSTEGFALNNIIFVFYVGLQINYSLPKMGSWAPVHVTDGANPKLQTNTYEIRTGDNAGVT